MGFYPLKADNIIYRLSTTEVIIPIYINDFLIIGKRLVIINVKISFIKIFYMKDLSAVKYFINVRIIRDRVNRIISLVQDGYLKKVLLKFNILNCSPHTTLIEISIK